MVEQEFRHIVRIAGKDVDGSKTLVVALSNVRGIGYNLAQLLLQQLGISPNIRTGYIREEDLSRIEDALREPTKVGAPIWYLNRRKDIESREDRHVITSDLDMTLRNDIEREKTVQSWRGIRHMYGLKVRGQRTRTTGRKGSTIGVRKGGKTGLTQTA